MRIGEIIEVIVVVPVEHPDGTPILPDEEYERPPRKRVLAPVDLPDRR